MGGTAGSGRSGRLVSILEGITRLVGHHWLGAAAAMTTAAKTKAPAPTAQAGRTGLRCFGLRGAAMARESGREGKAATEPNNEKDGGDDGGRKQRERPSNGRQSELKK